MSNYRLYSCHIFVNFCFIYSKKGNLIHNQEDNIKQIRFFAFISRIVRRIFMMKLYTTSGSMDFMESIRKKYPNETMVVMHGAGNSILIHETEGKSTFQTPHTYMVLDGAGPLKEEGFFALNYIPTSDEGRPIFEHWLLRRANLIATQKGLISYRILRPEASNTYVIMTQWTGKFFFESWQDTPSYHEVIAEGEKGAGLHKQPHMFASAPYVATYKVNKDDYDHN